LAKEPGLTTAAVLTLAVGIGACTAMFGVLRAALLASLGIDSPDRVVVMWPQYGDTAGEFAYERYRDIGRSTTSFEQVALTGSTNWSGNVVLDNGRPFKATQCGTSAEFFDVLGARPALGRTFRPEDDRPGARPVIVLSARFWRTRLGADPHVVGRMMTIDRQQVEVIGVMPPEFFYPAGADYWSPAMAELVRTAQDRSPAGLAKILDGVGAFHLVARVKPGISRATAETDATSAACHTPSRRR
jgi:hypothetical protein